MSSFEFWPLFMLMFFISDDPKALLIEVKGKTRNSKSIVTFLMVTLHMLFFFKPIFKYSQTFLIR